MKKRRLLILVKSKADSEAILALLKAERPGYGYDVAELPADADPTDVVYEIHATTPTDWRGGKLLLAFVEGAATALGLRPAV